MRRLKRTMRKIRIVMVWSLALLLTTDATLARGLFCRPMCRPVYCYRPCVPVYCPPCPPPCKPCPPPCSSTTVKDQATPHNTERPVGDPAPEAPSESKLSGSLPAPVESTEKKPNDIKQPEQPDVVTNKAAPALDPPKLETPPSDAGRVETAGAEEPAAKSAPVEIPVIKTPQALPAPVVESAPSKAEAPIANEPAAEPKEEAPVAKIAEPEATPAENPLDIFGKVEEEPAAPKAVEAAPMKVEEKAQPTDDGLGLFDAPADKPMEEPKPIEEPAPAAKAAEAPADVDALFGEPTEEAAPKPMEEPAPEAKPADALFDEPVEEAKPMEKAAADELFGEPTAPAKPVAPATENRIPPAAPADNADALFGEPSKPEPAKPQPAPANNADALFGEAPAEASKAEATPPPMEKPEEKAEEKKADPLDALFGPQTSTGVRGGLSSRHMRQWVDNTGSYKIQGRLILILSGKVRILKESGRTTTVPFTRLSQADLNFVHGQKLAAERENLIDRTVAR